MSRSTPIIAASKPSRDARNDLARASRFSWLTHSALLVAIAVVVCRLLISEQLRSPSGAISDAPLGAGATTTLFLDLFACVPALLVLTRRCLDPSLRLRGAWVAVPALLLGAWAVLSAAWSTDRFAAIVGSFTFFSAMSLMWASIQIVGSWFRFRIIAGVCVGLFLILTAVGYWYRVSDWPDLKSQWAQDREQILHSRDWSPESFEATQFEKRILSGQIMGYSTSPNTHAALLVLLGTIVAGIAIQRWVDTREIHWPIVFALLILLAIPTAWWTGCRAAVVTSAGAGIVLMLRGLLGPFIVRKARWIYAGTVAAFLLGASFVVLLGLTRGTLLHSSLTFRWWYWVASAHLFTVHPILGVGWDNFGNHYLAARLPIASEEIRDPHNFVVRTAVELGSVGLLLLIAWMVRLWWDLTTRPARSADEANQASFTPRIIALVVVIAGVSLGLSAIAGIDFVNYPAYAFMEVTKRIVFSLLLIGGLVLGATRARIISQTNKAALGAELVLAADHSPAPWVLIATIAGLGFFLVHSLIDFAFSEIGPMYLFALLSGAAISMRQTEGVASDSDQQASKSPLFALIGGVALWLVFLIVFVIPIARAEQAAHDADDAMRETRESNGGGAGHAEASSIAGHAMAAAVRLVPYNSDYAVRAATFLIGSRDPADRTQSGKLLDAAVAADPDSIGALLTRAQFKMLQNPPAIDAARADFEQALQLDPRNVRLRLRLVELLIHAGDRAAARHQIERALLENDGLTKDEIKRLSAADVRRYQAMADGLR